METRSIPVPLPRLVLRDGPVILRFAKIVSPVGSGLAPYYHFRILAGCQDVGHINLRIGEGEHLRRVVGHIGYGIRRRSRGHAYALSACRALGPFASVLRRETILTCDPSNHASKRTLEHLAGELKGEKVLVPVDDPRYRRGERLKLRFRWVPAQG